MYCLQLEQCDMMEYLIYYEQFERTINYLCMQERVRRDYCLAEDRGSNISASRLAYKSSL